MCVLADFTPCKQCILCLLLRSEFHIATSLLMLLLLNCFVTEDIHVADDGTRPLKSFCGSTEEDGLK